MVNHPLSPSKWSFALAPKVGEIVTDWPIGKNIGAVGQLVVE